MGALIEPATAATAIRCKFIVTTSVLVQGPPSPMALIRTFGSSEEPRVKLYRDHAAWCAHT